MEGGVPVRMRGSDELMQLYNSERRRRLLSQMPVCLHNPVRGELEPRRASRRRFAPTLAHAHTHAQRGRSVSRSGGDPRSFPRRARFDVSHLCAFDVLVASAMPK